jgi:hypothetical protein
MNDPFTTELKRALQMFLSARVEGSIFLGFGQRF